MPHEAIFQLVVYFGVVGIIFSLIVAAAIKFLERALTFGQAFLISLVTNFVTWCCTSAERLPNHSSAFLGMSIYWRPSSCLPSWAS